MTVSTPRRRATSSAPLRLLAALLVIASVLGVSPSPAAATASPAITTLNLLGPAGGEMFGEKVLVLSNGNFVVVDSMFDVSPSATNAGAVYLYNGATSTLISSFTGSTTGDRVGRDGVFEVGSGNFVVVSSDWDNGPVEDVGAVTWGNGTTGLNGSVSAANSLIGSTFRDNVGTIGAVTVLTNGNYVVHSQMWDDGASTNAGAVTWGSGATGVSGAVSTANSLHGDGAGRGGVVALTNGNYVVGTPGWNQRRGAATWGSGTTGISGPITTANSLHGATTLITTGDEVGHGIVALTNGNYVVASPGWNGGAGAATWGDGATGTTGAVTTSNSLHGTNSGDTISGGGPVGPNSGGGILALANGNYVVRSPFWDNGGVSDVGAATWGNGAAGTTGAVSTANSLVGTTASDRVGGPGVVALTNGNYVVPSPKWDNGATVDVGAATWGDGSTGTSGAVSTTNSLYGTTAGDQVGGSGLISGIGSIEGYVAPLTNGNYVVLSPVWDNGAVVNVGAVTWGNGVSGTTGPVTTANSLHGSTAEDRVGSQDIGGSLLVTPLANGNYVVASPLWDNAAAFNAGAATWASGAGGTVGAVTTANSLYGTNPRDGQVLTATALTNGNYVASFQSWDNSAQFIPAPAGPGGSIASDVGAAVFGNGTGGTVGPVTEANSLHGSTPGDQVGTEITALPDGNYAVTSPNWNNNGAANPIQKVNAGAVTFAVATGLVGNVTSSNSAIGSPYLPPIASRIVMAPSDRYTSGEALPVPTSQNRVLLMQLDLDQASNGLTSLPPGRLYESRIGADYKTFDGLQQGVGRTAAGGVAEVQVAGRAGVPANAAAAFLNVVAVTPSGGGYLTVFPCGTAPPLAANVNYNGGDIAANAVLAKIGTGGKVCVFSLAETDLVIDLNGYAPPGKSPTPVAPTRVLESRSGPDYITFDGQYQAGGRTAAGAVAEVQIAGRAGVPADASAAFLNVVAVSPSGGGYLTVFPCGTAPPLAANVNYNGGDVAANAVLAKIGTGGKVCVFTFAETDLVIDLNGFVPAGESPFPVDPARLYESRIGPGLTTYDGLQQGTGRTAAGAYAEVQVTGRAGVPANASAVFMNVVAVSAAGGGYLTVFPCGAMPPLAANVNYNGGDIAANAVLARVGLGGKVCVYTSSETDLVVDVNGYATD